MEHGGLPVQLPGIIDQLPDGGILDPESPPRLGDPQPPVIADEPVFLHRIEQPLPLGCLAPDPAAE